MTEIEINKAIALYEEGRSFAEIGRELGLHPFSIQNALKKEGIRLEKRKGKLDVKRAMKLKEEGFNYSQISRELGVSTSTVQRRLKRKYGSAKVYREDTGTSFDVKEAIRLFEEGLGWTKISKVLNVHPYSIQYKLESLGYKMKKVEIGRLKLGKQ